LRLNLPRRTKRRLPLRARQPLAVPALPNAVWSIDFMSDCLYSGRRFRTLNVLDEGVREALAIEIDTLLPSERVVRALEQLSAWRGLPRAIRLDNGPELLAQQFVDWCEEHSIELRYIQPGKPDQNAYIERHALELGVLGFELLEPLKLGRLQPTVLGFPFVVGGRADAMLAPDLIDRDASIGFLEDGYDL
jgi:transposase InsO family protein